MPANQSHGEPVKGTSRYSPEAYQFVMEALSCTVKKIGERRHLTGRELLEGIRDLALDSWGLMARPVLNSWGVNSTDDFGEIVFSLIDARAVGLTGFRVEPPYVREGLLFAFGSGASVWFAPWPVPIGASGWVQNFKVAELTRCRPSSLIKAALVALPVGVLANFLYISIFWRIAPIPSATYPYAQAMLPIWAFNMSFWMSTTMPGGTEAASFAASIFKLDWLLVTVAVFTLLHVYNMWAEKRKITWRLNLIGLAVGMVTPIPFTVSILIGALFALWIRRRQGGDWFDRFKNVIVAGLVVGEGAVVGIFAAISALKSSLLNLPY